MNEETSSRSLVESYAGAAADEMPIGAYATLIAVFSSVAAAALAVGARRKALPARLETRDIALLGIATHALARIITRDKVTAPLRAPFTRYEGTAGAGEVREEPRGVGLRRALGNLLTCQYCAAPWITLALATGLVARPRETRLVASGLAVVTVSDFLHQLYAFARQASAPRSSREASA